MKGLLIFVLCLAPAFAQPPRAYFPWWESPLARELNLSEDQRERIRTIVRESRDVMIDKRAAAEKAEAEIEDLFGELVIDQVKAQQAIDRLVAARGELTRAFTEMSLKLRMVLTYDQWKELQQKRTRWRPFGEGRERPGPPDSRRPRTPRSPPGDDF
jgi:Spy/CpxP family protein refolding chaperone